MKKKVCVIMNDIANIVIQGLSEDSRQVKQNFLYLAFSGDRVDGKTFIKEAIEKGAVGILSDDSYVGNIQEVPIIPFSDLKKNRGHLAARFFSYPSKNLGVIGITGTNGKTSCAHFIAQLLAHCGKKCGVIGTLGIGFIDQLKANDCTTPGAITIQESLAQFRDNGAEAVAMEVSSHALMQYRATGTEFHTAIFTNLTRDHLDYHKDMNHYWAAKKKLFKEFTPKNVFINLDDEYGRELFQEEHSISNQARKIFGFTTSNTSSDNNNNIISTDKLSLTDFGIRAHIKTPWGNGELLCPILGHFNLSNILAALGAVCAQGVPFDKALNAIQNLQTVPGRMVHVGGNKSLPTVVIDYAHTPDALIQILTAVRPHCRGKLWCIFGCGGDRDRGKRPLMAKAAERLSDHVIIAPDNPRTEDLKQIFDDMIQGFSDPKAIRIEYDRRLAIQYAIQSAKAEDLVVIAGKGHEDYQVVNQDRLPFCDKTEAQNALQERLNGLS